MKHVSTGFGLCIVGLGIAAWPVLDRLMPQANALGVGSVTPAVVAGALAQDPPAPTIVWYQAMARPNGYGFWLVRAWSDGRIEARYTQTGNTRLEDCNPNASPFCQSQWYVVNDPAQGLTFDADLNFDQAVDGVDLGMMLAKWGPAPRNPVPPSDCPLALINP
jgi:hypothetical protein